MAGASHYWDDPKRVEQLKKLWGQGYSASQIAARLGGGISRSGVIGKIHRLGLPGRATIVAAPHIARPARPKSPIHDRLVEVRKSARSGGGVKRAEPPAARLEDGRLIGTMDLAAQHCRWPHGDPGSPGFHYCGCKTAPGTSWCLDHLARVFAVPRVVRKRDGADLERAEAERQAARQFARIWG